MPLTLRRAQPDGSFSRISHADNAVYVSKSLGAQTKTKAAFEVKSLYSAHELEFAQSAVIKI